MSAQNKPNETVSSSCSSCLSPKIMGTSKGNYAQRLWDAKHDRGRIQLLLNVPTSTRRCRHKFCRKRQVKEILTASPNKFANAIYNFLKYPCRMESLSQLSKSLFQLFTGLCFTRATVFYAVFRHLFHLPPVTAVPIMRHTFSLDSDLTATSTTLFAFAFFGFPVR